MIVHNEGLDKSRCHKKGLAMLEKQKKIMPINKIAIFLKAVVLLMILRTDWLTYYAFKIYAMCFMQYTLVIKKNKRA